MSDLVTIEHEVTVSFKRQVVEAAEPANGRIYPTGLAIAGASGSKTFHGDSEEPLLAFQHWIRFDGKVQSPEEARLLGNALYKAANEMEAFERAAKLSHQPFVKAPPAPPLGTKAQKSKTR